MTLSSAAAANLVVSTPASAEAPTFTAQVIDSTAAFAGLAAEWNGLALRTSPTPMTRHEWLLAAALCFPHRRLAVFLIRDDAGRLRAAAPFAVTRFGPFERLSWLSHEMHEPQALLYDHPLALQVLWAAVRRAGRPVVARRLTPRPGELEALRSAPGALVMLRPGTTRTAAAPVGGAWADFEAAMSANSRSEMRRKRRGLEKHGAVGFDALSPGPGELDALLDALIRVEASGWKGRERSAIVFRPELEAFLRDYGRRAAEAGLLRLFFLTLDGQPVAAQMLVEEDRRLWQFKIGYDERWERYSPGRLLMFDILRWANAQGLETVEYLGHGGSWQTRWPARLCDHDTLRFYPPTPGGLAALLLDLSESVRRRLNPARAGDPPKRERSPDQAADTREGDPAESAS